MNASAETPHPWLAVAVLLIVGAVAVTAILVATVRQTRRMNELWEAARQADREWYAAMYRYLATPVKPKPVVKQVSDDAITVELEVISVERNEKDG